MTAVPRLSIGLGVDENYLTESLLGQSSTDFELIISDNASADNTRDICLSYARRESKIRYFRQERIIEFTVNCNFAMQQARGEFFPAASHDDPPGSAARKPTHASGRASVCRSADSKGREGARCARVD